MKKVELNTVAPLAADYAVMVHNNDMSPTIIPGDYALIRKGWTEDMDGAILAINTEGGVKLARMRSHTGQGLFTLSADIPGAVAEVMTLEGVKALDIIGHVVGLQRAI